MDHVAALAIASSIPASCKRSRKWVHSQRQSHDTSGPMGEARLEKATVMAGPIAQETQP